MEAVAKNRSRKVLSLLVKVFLLATLAGISLPLFLSLSPSDKAKAIGQPILVDIGGLSIAQPIILEWRGHKHYVIARSELDIDSLNSSYLWGFYAFPIGETYDRYLRSVRDDIFIVTALCPHKNCEIKLASAADFESLSFEYDRDRLFWDPCHGWFFDLAGRYLGDSDYKSRATASREPKIRTLPVPDYRFVGESVIELGQQ